MDDMRDDTAAALRVARARSEIDRARPAGRGRAGVRACVCELCISRAGPFGTEACSTSLTLGKVGSSGERRLVESGYGQSTIPGRLSAHDDTQGRRRGQPLFPSVRIRSQTILGRGELCEGAILRPSMEACRVKTPEESERAFKYFTDLVVFIKSFSRVNFITASDAAVIFRDRAQKHVFTLQEIIGLAGQVEPEGSFQVGTRFNLSASEVFFLLNKFVANIVQRRGAEPIILDGGDAVWSGSESTPLAVKTVIPWEEFARGVVQVQERLDKTGQIPASVSLGSQSIPPESYLVGLAQAAETLTQKGEPPESVILGPAHLASAEFVAENTPALWDWALLPPGFDGTKLMSLAKLQAWTLKPARK